MNETSYDLRALQLMELMGLLEFDRVCKKYEIPYYLYGGTAIGAVRHRGFIPWDDDVDVLVREEDYTRLDVAMRAELDAKRYFWQTHETDPDYWRAYPKLRVNGTTFMEEKSEAQDMHHGVFVDVFILRGIANPGRKRRSQKRFFSYTTHLLVEGPPKGGIKRPVFRILKAILPKGLIYRFDYWNLHRYSMRDTKDYFDASSPWWFDRCMFAREWFKEPVMMEFEGHLLPMPTGWKEMLTQLYGDYMQPPPENERQPKHAYLVDLTQEHFGLKRKREDCIR